MVTVPIFLIKWRSDGRVAAITALASGLLPLLLLGAAAAARPASASARPDLVALAAGTVVASGGESLQAVFERARKRSGAPGAEAAIVVDGRLIWSADSGVAVIATGAPVISSTVFVLASATKTYTAALTLRLVEEGALQLDDTVGQWLGRRVPVGVRSTTVRQLLQMTSGIPDYLEDRAVAAALEEPNHRWSERELLEAVKDPIKPGRFNYSNTNYILLGAIDSRAGQAPIGELLGALVLEPLGLSETFLDRVPGVARRFANGYEFGATGRPIDTFTGARSVPTSFWGPLWTDGGIATNASELARFANDLYLGHLLEPETLATMLAPGPDGSYGMGTYTQSLDGHVFHGHDGAYGGFSSDDFTDIERGVTIVALANGENRLIERDPADDIWPALARAYDAGAR